MRGTRESGLHSSMYGRAKIPTSKNAVHFLKSLSCNPLSRSGEGLTSTVLIALVGLEKTLQQPLYSRGGYLYISTVYIIYILLTVRVSVCMCIFIYIKN